MTKGGVRRLIELVHIFYTERMSDDEAAEYLILYEEYDMWIEGMKKITYQGIMSKIGFRFNEVGYINVYDLWKIVTENKFRISYSAMSIAFRITMVRMIKDKKAIQIRNMYYQILIPRNL